MLVGVSTKVCQPARERGCYRAKGSPLPDRPPGPEPLGRASTGITRRSGYRSIHTSARVERKRYLSPGPLGYTPEHYRGSSMHGEKPPHPWYPFSRARLDRRKQCQSQLPVEAATMRQEPPQDRLVLRRTHKCVPRYRRCRPHQLHFTSVSPHRTTCSLLRSKRSGWPSMAESADRESHVVRHGHETTWAPDWGFSIGLFSTTKQRSRQCRPIAK